MKPIIERPARPIGRPRSVPGPAKSMSTYLPIADADRVIAIASRRGVSVGAVLRRIVILHLHGEGE